MEIKYNTNGESPEEISITGPGNDWGIRGDKLWVTVDKVNVTPYSEDECIASVFGEGVKCLTCDIISVEKEINTLKAENESLKETIEVLQRQLEKLMKDKSQGVDNNRDALDARTYSVFPILGHDIGFNNRKYDEHMAYDAATNNAQPDHESSTAMNIIIARYNETVMENNRLRKRNRKLKQDFESIKGHLRTAQHKLDKYERDKHYSEMFVANHSGQSLTFKDSKASISSNGDVTVSGESVDSLIYRIKQLCETEKKLKEWRDIVLKNIEVTPDILDEHIKEN